MKLQHLWDRPAFRFSLFGGLLFSLLWALSPGRSLRSVQEEGVVEISYMAPAGPLKDAVEDAVREFEFLSRRRHEETNGAYPIYRVIAGQHASANQVEDPTRFILSLVGGEPPDVIFFDRFAISEWASRGTFLPLDSFVEKDLRTWDAWQADPTQPEPWPGARAEAPRAPGARPLAAIEPIRPEDFYSGCWREAMFQDPRSGEIGLYGIPNDADNRVLLYNKDLLIKHGYVDALGQPRPPRTWEELEEMAVAMTKTRADGSYESVGFIPNYGNSFLYLYGWQNGGEFMSDDLRTCTLNSPPIVDALAWMTRVYDKLGGAENVAAFQTTFRGDALDPFIQGQVAMKIDGVWVMSTLARYGADLNIGAAPAPLPAARVAAGEQPLSWLGGWAYAIPATSDKSAHAWELIRYLVSQRSLEIRLTSEAYQAEAVGQEYLPRQFPNRKQNEWAFENFVAANPRLQPKFKEIMRVFNDMLPASRYRPNTPVGQRLWNAQLWATEDAINHKRTPQEALDYYTRMVQRDLDGILYPPEGKTIRSWTWFFVLYAGIALAVMAAAYAWDAHVDKRLALAARIPLLQKWMSRISKDNQLEGRRGSFFRSQWREGWICASPWIIGFLLFTGGPLLFSIVIAFCRYDVLRPAVFTGWENFRLMMVEDELFWISLKNTVFMVIGVPLGIVVGLGMAILLTREVKGTALWRTCFYLPSIVPMVASSILWVWILNPQSGMMNQILASVGIQGPNWLQSPDTSKWSLILMGLWSAGGGMIIWIAGIKGISTSYYEAASIDGAGSWKQFVNITLPMLSPYIFFNVIMGLIGTFQVFTQAFIMTAGGPVNSTLFYVYHLFNNAFRYLHMGYAAAMAWFLFVIVLILTAVQMKLSKKWVHYEGI
jgi:multiple sugar transport system permease protein